MFRGKKYQDSAKKIDKNAQYDANEAMGLVVDEEPHASVYFIRDPEGYLVEIGDGALYDNIAKQTQ